MSLELTASAGMPSGLQGILLWVAVAVGVAGCTLVFWVTVRHRLRVMARNAQMRATMTGIVDMSGATCLPDASRMLAQQGADTCDIPESPVGGEVSLLAEVLWVATPLLMMLGLGGWVVLELLAGRAT